MNEDSVYNMLANLNENGYYQVKLYIEITLIIKFN